MLLETLHKGSLALTGKDPTGSSHGRGRALTTSRRWTGENFSTHETQCTCGNTTSRDDVKNDDVPQFPSLFNFITTSFTLTNFCYNVLSAFLSPRGQVLSYKHMF